MILNMTHFHQNNMPISTNAQSWLEEQQQQMENQKVSLSQQNSSSALMPSQQEHSQFLPQSNSSNNITLPEAHKLGMHTSSSSYTKASNFAEHHQSSSQQQPAVTVRSSRNVSYAPAVSRGYLSGGRNLGTGGTANATGHVSPNHTNSNGYSSNATTGYRSSNLSSSAKYLTTATTASSQLRRKQ